MTRKSRRSGSFVMPIDHDAHLVRSGSFFEVERDNGPSFNRFLCTYSRNFDSWRKFGRTLLDFVPPIRWIPKYSPSRQLPGDLLGGTVLSLFNLPLAIACSNLAGVPLVSGLYTMMLAAFFYPIFSNWPHGSMGPFAAIDIATGEHARMVMSHYYDDLSNITNTEMFDLVNPSTITSSMVFLNGVLCIVFGLLRLDFVTEYFSEPLVGGFTSGIAFYVVVSQVDGLLGIQKPPKVHVGYQFPPALQRWCHRRCVVVPWEFILLVLSTWLSAGFRLNENYGVYVVGELPSGLPIPELPNFSLLPDLFWSSLTISTVQMCTHVFAARILARRVGYRVDRRQEMYAVGGTLLLSSFFPVYAANSGVGAATILEQAGSTSQVSIVLSAFILLLTVLFAAPLFHHFPTCVMAVIVLMVVGRQLNGLFQVPHLWKASKWDFCIWTATFLASVSRGIVLGLSIGIGFQLFTVVARTQWPRWTVWYSRRDSRSANVCIFEFESMLLFTNGQKFVFAVQKTVEKWCAQDTKPSNRVFVLDCTAMIDVDAVGLSYLVEVLKDLHRFSLVYLVRPRWFLVKTLREKGVNIDDEEICESVEEAVNRADRRIPAEPEQHKNGDSTLDSLTNVAKF